MGPQLKIPEAGTACGPALAGYEPIPDGRKTVYVYAAWPGVADDDAIYWAATTEFEPLLWERAQWSKPTVIPGVSTAAPVSLASSPGRLYAAWRGANEDEHIYWASREGLEPWEPKEPINGAGTFWAPALAVSQGSLVAAWRGVGDDEGIYWSYLDGGAWHEQKRIPDAGSIFGPTLATVGVGAPSNETLFAAWGGAGEDENAYWSTLTALNGSWAERQQMIGVGTSSGPALASSIRGAVYAVWKGAANDERIYRSYKFPGKGWVPPQPNLNIGTSGRPALTNYRQTPIAAWKGAGEDEGVYWAALGRPF